MAGVPPEPRREMTPELTPELRDYVLACLRAARPSRLRTQAIDTFARAAAEPALPTGRFEPIDWDSLEAEAAGRGITLADLIAEQGSDDQDPFRF
jgi:hypothetical protein